MEFRKPEELEGYRKIFDRELSFLENIGGEIYKNGKEKIIVFYGPYGLEVYDPDELSLGDNNGNRYKYLQNDG